MLKAYSVTLENIGILFFFLAVGFVMRKKGVLPAAGGKTLSVLETTLFLPAVIFSNLSANLTVQTLHTHAVALAAGAVFLAASLALAHILARIFDRQKARQRLLTYIFTFSNYGYFGYPLIRAVFGEEMLAHTIVFAIPFTLTIYTYGVRLLTPQTKSVSLPQTLKKALNPVIIAVFLGAVCGLTGFSLPTVLKETVSAAAACMSPISMILTGFILGVYRFKDLFRQPFAYVVSAVRVIALPAFFAILLKCLGISGENCMLPVIIACMPVGMNVVVFPTAYGNDAAEPARICFISYLFSLITIPLFFSLLYRGL
ncbi:MAG: AEC family transporter [Eubacteriales bacterium]